MSHDIDITDIPGREVSLSFTAGGKGCWIFEVLPTDGSPESDEYRGYVCLTQEEALAAAKYIQEFYA